MSDTDWLKIGLELSKSPLRSGNTAHEGVMKLLLTELSNLLKITNSEAERIWTLHDVVGNYVHFYASSRRERLDTNSNMREITDGLIGKAIEIGDDVQFFEDAKSKDGYVEGWEKCEAELIILVKDHHKVIGVINIESNDAKDFFYESSKSKSQYESEKQLLKIFTRLAANHIAVVLKNKILNEKNKSNLNLIDAISDSLSSSELKFKKAIETAFGQLTENTDRLLHAAFYLSLSDKGDTYKLIGEQKRFYSGNVAKPTVTKTNRELFDDTIKVIKEIKQIEDIFEKKLTEDEDVFWVGANSNEQLEARKYFIIVLMADQNKYKSIGKNSISDESEHVEDCFKVIKKITARYLKNASAEFYNKLKNQTLSMYQLAIKDDSLKEILTQIAIRIADNSCAEICLIYLVASPKYRHDLRKTELYLCATNKTGSDFQNICIAQNENELVYSIFNNKKSHYFSNSESKKQTYIPTAYLQDENPNIFGFPLRLKNTDIKLGTVLLFFKNRDERSENRQVPSISKVEVMAEEWSEHLSNIIYSKNKNQANNTLLLFYKELIGSSPSIAKKHESIDSLICDFQPIINKVFSRLWSDLFSSVFFVTYKKTGSMFSMLGGERLFPKGIDSKPPTFEPGKGLTGSVMEKETKEIYEPFIENMSKKGEHPFPENYALPDDTCKIFWDEVLNDGKRMYYGKYLNIKGTDYVFVIVGARKGNFLPDLGYFLSHNSIEIVCELIESIIDENNIFYSNKEKSIKKGEKMSSNKSSDTNITITNSNIASINSQDSKETVNQEINNVSTDKQTLNDAAKEIQDLLEQLGINNPDATRQDKEKYINSEITTDMRERAINALTAGGESLLSEVIGSSYTKVIKDIIKGWKKNSIS